jgi:cholinesterase
MSAKKILSVILALLSISSAAFAAPPTSVVVYGDSLSDNGNLYQATGEPGAPYYNGRRSNGPVAVEQLASALNVPLIDYAWIGATTGVGNYADRGTVTSQGRYNLRGMTTVYNLTKESLNPYLSEGLFVVWGGPNDFLAPSPLDSTPAEIIFRALTNELAIILDLQSRGARTILAPGMPDLGLTPYFQSLGPEAAAGGSAITDAFNAGLQAELPPGVLYYDTAGLLRSVVNNPAAYGFTNATEAYYLPTRENPFGPGDPNDYIFFDDFHPSAATHAIIAREFLQATAVPEPSTIIILGSGFTLLLFRRRRH